MAHYFPTLTPSTLDPAWFPRPDLVAQPAPTLESLEANFLAVPMFTAPPPLGVTSQAAKMHPTGRQEEEEEEEEDDDDEAGSEESAMDESDSD